MTIFRRDSKGGIYCVVAYMVKVKFYWYDVCMGLIFIGIWEKEFFHSGKNSKGKSYNWNSSYEFYSF